MRSVLIKAFLLLLAAAANVAVGSYWYGTEFSREWTAASHRNGSEFRHPSDQQFLFAAFGSLVTAIVLSFIGRRAAGKNAGFFRRQIVVLGVAIVAWLGFVFASAARHYAFLGHSPQLLVVDSGFDLAGMLVMGLLVATV